MNTSGKFKYMMSLLTKAGLQGRRHAICWNISGQRTESATELNAAEVQAIIDQLETHFKTEDKADKMRKKIIAWAHQMQWKTGGRADMHRIDAWCVKYGHWHKELNKHTITELPTLLTQFERAYKHYMANI